MGIKLDRGIYGAFKLQCRSIVKGLGPVLVRITDVS